MYKRIKIIAEAIENPKGPARIPTGSGKTALDNPAYSDRAYYEGDPAQFDFGAQRRNYQTLSTALARNGKKFDYIAVAKAENGRDIFIATAPGIVWYKYESGSTQAGQNILYVNGVKTKTTGFISQTPEQQDAMLNADPSDLRLKKGDVFGYLSTIAKSPMPPVQVLQNLESKRELILHVIFKEIIGYPEKVTKLETVNRLLIKKTVLPQWLMTENIKTQIQPKLAESIYNNLLNWITDLPDRIKKFKQYNLITTYQYIIEKIDQNKDAIRERMIKHILNMNERYVEIYYEFFTLIGYSDSMLDIKNITNSISAADLFKPIPAHIRFKQGDISFYINSMLNIGIPKTKLVEAIETQKQKILSHVLINFTFNDISTIDVFKNLKNSLSLLDISWNELDDVNIKKLMNDNKNSLIVSLLQFIKKNSTYTSLLKPVLKHLDYLESLGINWPEIATMKKSVDHTLSINRNNSVNEQRKTNNMYNTLQINEDLGNLTQLGVGPLINTLKQTYYSNRRGANFITPDTKKFAGSFEIGPTSEIIDLGVVKRDLLKKIRAAFKQNNARAFAVYIGGKPVLFAVTDDYALAGASRLAKVAYDFSNFQNEYNQAFTPPPSSYFGYNKKPIASTRDSEEREYSSYGTEPTIKKTHYTGDVYTTSDLATLLSAIEKIATLSNNSITVKIVLEDRLSKQKRTSRLKLNPTKQDAYEMKKDLMVRLARYKNTKRPTANTIEEFIKFAINGAAKVVNFAGYPYQMTANTYENINAQALLTGKPFTVRYKSNDPVVYQTVDVFFMFDRETNILKPFKATWRTGGQPGEYGSNEELAILDIKSYLKTELNVQSMNKDKIIPAMLKMIKSSPNALTYRRILALIKVLKAADMDWPELDTIEHSVKLMR